MPDDVERLVNCDGFQPATKRTVSPPLKSLHRLQGSNERCLKHILGIRALAGGGTQAASYRGEQAFSEAYAQFLERLLTPASGPFDELLFSSFVMHGHEHFIYISLEPPKALAENTN